MKIAGVKRNVPQTKEHKKSLGKKLNDMDAPKIPDAEFKTMITGYSMTLGKERMISVRT